MSCYNCRFVLLIKFNMFPVCVWLHVAFWGTVGLLFFCKNFVVYVCMRRCQIDTVLFLLFA